MTYQLTTYRTTTTAWQYHHPSNGYHVLQVGRRIIGLRRSRS